jgi:hypothetical protein
MVKSILAVVAGFLTVVVLSSVTDVVMEKAGVFPPPTNPELYVTWMWVVALFYRTIYTILGGYITAYLAPQSVMKHVWTLAVLGQIGGLMGVYIGWDLGAKWYCIALAALAIPSVLFGAWLRTRKTGGSESPV